MPSDCQCSSSVVIREVVLNDREATLRLQRLEKEVKRLRIENARLDKDLKRASKTKEEILKELKGKLDTI